MQSLLQFASSRSTITRAVVPKRRLQVFISSTYTDLVKERQAAVQAVLEAGHIPAGMELFSAGNESQLTTIRHWIDESDIYMLILGVRYGSIEPTSGKSYTQVEYEYALERGKSLFAIYLNDRSFEERVSTLAYTLVAEDRKSYEEFRRKVKSKICEEFGDARDVTISVLKALSRFERSPELADAGWVRTTDVPDSSELLQENARLSRQVAMLTAESAKLSADLAAANAGALTRPTDIDLEFRDNMYWKRTGEGAQDGPFCSRCWDVEKILVRVTCSKSYYPVCHNCKSTVQSD